MHTDIPIHVLCTTESEETKEALKGILNNTVYQISFCPKAILSKEIESNLPDIIIFDNHQKNSLPDGLKQQFSKMEIPILFLEKEPHLQKPDFIQKQKREVTVHYPIVNHLLLEALNHLQKSLLPSSIIFDRPRKIPVQIQGHATRISSSLLEISAGILFDSGEEIRVRSNYLPLDPNAHFKATGKSRFSQKNGEYLTIFYLPNKKSA